MLITNEKIGIVIGLRYEKGDKDRPEVVLARKDFKHVKELIAENSGCVVTSIHEPTIARVFFAEYKEGELIKDLDIRVVASVYSKLKDKKIVI